MTYSLCPKMTVQDHMFIDFVDVENFARQSGETNNFYINKIIYIWSWTIIFEQKTPVGRTIILGQKEYQIYMCFEHRFFDDIHKAEEKVGFGHQPTCATLAKRYRAKVRLLLESSNASMENPATVPATNLSPPPNNLSCSKIIEANSYHMFHVIEPGNTQQLYIGVDWRIKFPFVLGSTWGHKWMQIGRMDKWMCLTTKQHEATPTVKVNYMVFLQSIHRHTLTHSRYSLSRGLQTSGPVGDP